MLFRPITGGWSLGQTGRVLFLFGCRHIIGKGWGGGGGKRPKRKSPARIAGLPPRRGELRCGGPVVWLPDFRLQPHFFSITSRANPSQANLLNSTPTDAPCN